MDAVRICKSGRGRPDDPIAAGKYDILQRISEIDVAPLVLSYGLEVDLGIELDGNEDSIYNYGKWAAGILDLSRNSARVIFSHKAVTDLSNLAFEGLVYHEVAELFMGRFFAEAVPEFIIADMNGYIPYTKKEVMVDALVNKFFRPDVLVPFRAETANIEYDSGRFDIKTFEDYLGHLRTILPAIADELEGRLSFREELSRRGTPE